MVPFNIAYNQMNTTYLTQGKTTLETSENTTTLQTSENENYTPNE